MRILTDRFSTEWRRTGLRPEFSLAIGTGNFEYAVRMEIMSHFPNKHIVDVTVANKYKCVLYMGSKDGNFNVVKLIKNIDVPEYTLGHLLKRFLEIVRYSKYISRGGLNEQIKLITGLSEPKDD